MVCVSAATPGSANRTSVAAEIVGAILKFPPLWEAASKGAKEKMVKRAGELGIEWEAEVNQLRSAADWEQALKDATDPAVVENMPAYYKTSFHAYPEGNLGWDPALEVEVAAGRERACLATVGSGVAAARTQCPAAAAAAAMLEVEVAAQQCTGRHK